jgi:uracil-DNA glycosylase family protein
VAYRHPPAASAAEFLPKERDLTSLREAARRCHGCSLYTHATQVVFGEGRERALIFFVGEQPGDQEDVEGRPFVGPAGRLLDQCLEKAGIERKKAYVTNAVKHFKWEPQGKLRLHKKPTSLEVAACRPWLDSELAAVRPMLVVCLGATAAQELLGNKFLLTKHRGEIIEQKDRPAVTATIHPSAILRAPNPEAREEQIMQFIADLRTAARFVSTRREDR